MVNVLEMFYQNECLAFFFFDDKEIDNIIWWTTIFDIAAINNIKRRNECKVERNW